MHNTHNIHKHLKIFSEKAKNFFYHFFAIFSFTMQRVSVTLPNLFAPLLLVTEYLSAGDVNAVLSVRALRDNILSAMMPGIDYPAQGYTLYSLLLAFLSRSLVHSFRITVRLFRHLLPINVDNFCGIPPATYQRIVVSIQNNVSVNLVPSNSSLYVFRFIGLCEFLRDQPVIVFPSHVFYLVLVNPQYTVNRLFTLPLAHSVQSDIEHYILSRVPLQLLAESLANNGGGVVTRGVSQSLRVSAQQVEGPWVLYEWRDEER